MAALLLPPITPARRDGSLQRKQRRSTATPRGSPRLPAATRGESQLKSVLVLDLNGVLLKRNNAVTDVPSRVRLRPYAKGFVDAVGHEFELFVWTCGPMNPVVETELEAVFGSENIPMRVVTKESACTLVDPSRTALGSREKPLFLKDMGQLVRDRSALIIDDNLDKLELIPLKSCVVVPSWHGDDEDDEDSTLDPAGVLCRGLIAWATGQSEPPGFAYFRPTSRPTAPPERVPMSSLLIEEHATMPSRPAAVEALKQAHLASLAAAGGPAHWIDRSVLCGDGTALERSPFPFEFPGSGELLLEHWTLWASSDEDMSPPDIEKAVANALWQKQLPQLWRWALIDAESRAPSVPSHFHVHIAIQRGVADDKATTARPLEDHLGGGYGAIRPITKADEADVSSSDPAIFGVSDFIELESLVGTIESLLRQLFRDTASRVRVASVESEGRSTAIVLSVVLNLAVGPVERCFVKIARIPLVEAEARNVRTCGVFSVRVKSRSIVLSNSSMPPRSRWRVQLSARACAAV